MNAARRQFHIKFTGDFACFSRPEFTAERYTFPTMTPPAAEGALKSIFWKRGGMRWDIRRIVTHNPIRYVTFRRNEPEFEATLRKSQQRATTCLADVAFTVTADLVVRPTDNRHEPGFYWHKMDDALTRGRCFRRPHLGLREFGADFEAGDPNEPGLPGTLLAGPMPLHLGWERNGQPGDGWGDYGASDEHLTINPVFFDAVIRDGVLDVPQAVNA